MTSSRPSGQSPSAERFRPIEISTLIELAASVLVIVLLAAPLLKWSITAEATVAVLASIIILLLEWSRDERHKLARENESLTTRATSAENELRRERDNTQRASLRAFLTVQILPNSLDVPRQPSVPLHVRLRNTGSGPANEVWIRTAFGTGNNEKFAMEMYYPSIGGREFEEILPGSWESTGKAEWMTAHWKYVDAFQDARESKIQIHFQPKWTAPPTPPKT